MNTLVSIVGSGIPWRRDYIPFDAFQDAHVHAWRKHMLSTPWDENAIDEIIF